MPVYMQSQVRRFTFNQARLERSAQAILADVGEPSAELGILFVGDQRMRGLNRRYRGHDRTTDVLAFAMREACAPHASRLTPDMLGDVVISVPTAWRQAIEAGRSLEEELACLLVHGILHLSGYDHERGEKEARRMYRRERMILRSIAKLPKRANRTCHGSTGSPSRAKSRNAFYIMYHE
ncbi:MAG TPA: rRNA maturation RNase YbeY [Nitrospiraceae bacterium]|nr:rRNA maturation RNase YbeY [Nitrospiraceae bacterium]